MIYRFSRLALKAILFSIFSLLLCPTKAPAISIFFVGRVRENTADMNPVSGATVKGIFSIDNEFDAGDFMFTTTTDQNGYFTFTEDVGLEFTDFAKITVQSTSTTQAGTFFAGLETQLDISAVANLLGLNPGGGDLTNAAFELLTGISIPPNFLISTVLAQNVGAINAKVEPIQAIPEPLTILGTATAVGFGAFFKRQINKKKKDKK